MPHRRPVLITSGRHPFEVWPLFACTVVGGVMAIAPASRPRTITTSLPEPLLVAWLVLMSLGGLAGLVGSHWTRRIDTGLLVEAAGVLAVACMCTLYVLVLAAADPQRAFAAGGLLAGIGGGAWHRVGQIIDERRRLARARVEAPPVLVDLPLLVEPDDQDEPR